jgi:membrane protein
MRSAKVAMEGSRREHQETSHDQDGHGRSADSPVQIPKRGWRDILLRAKEGVERDNLSIVAGGTAFFLLLGLVPGLSALISVYGLIANPSDVQTQFDALSQGMPSEARTLLEAQMTRISSQHQTAGIAALLSILLALWGGAAAIKTIFNAVNIIYHEQEKRGYIKLTLVALGLAVTFVVLGVISIGAIVVLPSLLENLGLGEVGRWTALILRWPLLIVVALVGLAILYRYGPSREKPRWQWVSPGAMVATVVFGVGSALFALYAQHFGSYNKTYGSLGAVVVLMMWLYISAFALLLGAEINAEAEHQTARDSTTGPPERLGRRGAYVADSVGKAK